MRLRFVSFGLVLMLGAGAGFAQTPSAPAAPAESTPPPAATPAPAPSTPAAAPNPAPAEAQPVPQAQTPPSPAQAETAQPQTPATVQPAPAPSSSTPAASASPAPVQGTARSTLLPTPSDQTNVEQGVLAAKPAAVLSGTSTWEEAFTNLKNGFAKIEGELKKAGIAPTGRPLTVFVHTDDDGFRYEAMVPIAQAPEGRTELTPEIKFGKTPEGKTFRFVHKDAYDEIDGTYETITAYLDIKDIVAQDAFIEEYVSDFTDAQDTSFEVNIYVQPKE